MTGWRGVRVLVTGGSGFIGSRLVERLLEEGAAVRTCGRSREKLERFLGPAAGAVEFVQGDLLDPGVARAAAKDREAVFHLAAEVAGVGYNSEHPSTILHANAALGLSVLDAAVAESVGRVLLCSSACVYRRHCSVPTPEEEGFEGDPEPTNLGYGWAKRLLEVQGRCASMQHGLAVALPRPYNAYGPRDDFDWETSHVIPALIRKVVEGQQPIQVWGDGSQTRAFLYVDDFVEGLLACLERYATCDPVNLGSEEEVTIAELARMIADAAERDVEFRFDATRPGGQPRRIGNYAKARKELGFAARVPLAEGLRRTVEWYRSAAGAGR